MADTLLEHAMKCILWNILASDCGRPPSDKHQASNFFYFFLPVPLKSSVYRTMGAITIGRPPDADFKGWICMYVKCSYDWNECALEEFKNLYYS